MSTYLSYHDGVIIFSSSWWWVISIFTHYIILILDILLLLMHFIAIALLHINRSFALPRQFYYASYWPREGAGPITLCSNFACRLLVPSYRKYCAATQKLHTMPPPHISLGYFLSFITHLGQPLITATLLIYVVMWPNTQQNYHAKAFMSWYWLHNNNNFNGNSKCWLFNAKLSAAKWPRRSFDIVTLPCLSDIYIYILPWQNWWWKEATPYIYQYSGFI